MNSESTANNHGKNGRDRVWVAETVRRIQRGESVEKHFELLFYEYEPEVRHRLWHQGWRDTDLEDVVQDVMLRVYRGLGNFRFDSSFDTWILLIMTNAAKNAIRNRNTGKARVAGASLDSLLAGDDARPAMAEPHAPEQGPLDRALANQRKARLATALDQLPARVRQCLLLRYQGYRYQEIATAQGVSMATVKKQITQGHQRLRPILGSFVELFSVLLALTLLR